MGDEAEALTLIQEAQQLADRIGDQFSVAVTTTQRARVDADLGRFDDAIRQLDVSVGIFGDLGARWELADAMAEARDHEARDGSVGRSGGRSRPRDQSSEELGERQLASWTCARSRVCRRSEAIRTWLPSASVWPNRPKLGGPQ